VSRTSCSSTRASRSAVYEAASRRRRAPSPRPRPLCRRQGSAAAPPPSALPKSSGGLPLVLFFCVSPPPMAPLFIVVDRREADSSAGNSGGKGSGGKQRREVSGGRIQWESSGVAARGARASDWRCRSVPTLPIGSCRTGADTGAPAHLLGSPTRQRDFGGAGAGRFWAPSPKSTPATFWEAFWERRWRCFKDEFWLW
jgi:hypothetical protein